MTGWRRIEASESLRRDDCMREHRAQGAVREPPLKIKYPGQCEESDNHAAV
ncbi:MAG: hypothetical protein KKC76_06025 [Proteobacteria bacterium]|nr:hypothetical protein [Pseudomonadota bacterium]MBU4295903.1 hypothetical protein [Pseudomonadota bacterium]MCG2749099.1 hypothetical protein [Desulfobulbaceae bacterium]